MTNHPDIEELFADEVIADEPATGEAADEEVAATADEDETLDGDSWVDELTVDEPLAEEEETTTDDVAVVDEDDEDLLALVDEAVARMEQLTADAFVPDASAAEAEAETADANPEEPTDGAPAGDVADGDDRMVLQYPSNDFPPPPVFRLRVPQGWLAVPIPDALMAVREPDDQDGFHANVVVRNRRAVAAAGHDEAVAALRALDAVPEGMELLGEDVKDDGPTPARWVQVRFAAPDGRMLQARHLMIYIPVSRHVANLLTVVGTWAEDAPEETAETVRQTVGSLRLYLAPPA